MHAKHLMMRTIGKITAASQISLMVCGPAAAASCEIGPQSVSFGDYDTLVEHPLDGIGTISIVCDSETFFTVSLDRGAGSYAARRMTSGEQYLEYNLYTDASRIMVWGDGTAGSNTVTATGKVVEQSIYGRAAPLQQVTAGMCVDWLVVTFVY
jgi:spore coat protein U-like protein